MGTEDQGQDIVAGAPIDATSQKGEAKAAEQ